MEISADIVFSKKEFIGFVRTDFKAVYWQKKTDASVQIMRYDLTSHKIDALLPDGYSAKSKIYEYGGLSYYICRDKIFFINQQDQAIYQLVEGPKPVLVIEAYPNYRYADIVFDEMAMRLYALQEEHTKKSVIHRIVSIDLTNKEVTPLREGSDFYSSLTWCEENRQLAYLSWDLPNMPWQQSALHIATIEIDTRLSFHQKLVDKKDVSICQPKWGPDKKLYFCSDETGWYNLYQYDQEKITNMYPLEEEIGYPDWQRGFSHYTFVYDAGYKIVAASVKEAVSKLVEIDIKTKSAKLISSSYNYIDSLQGLTYNQVALIAGSPTTGLQVIIWDRAKNSFHPIENPSKSLPSENISLAKKINCRTKDGQKTHGFYYPPSNGNAQKAPLIVLCHGGPTGYTNAMFDLEKQYFTSKGFALLDVNYRGSAGFGRKYRDALRKEWGILDASDVLELTQFLCNEGKADPEKLIIRGRSAGGYLVLAVLTFHDLFKAGASYYGISDLQMLESDTHKFESGYSSFLIGEGKNAKKALYDRSPIHFIDKLSCPIIFFQGDEDKVVPPDQSENMYLALKNKKIPTAYVLFEKEGHGFQKKENLIKALESECAFYKKIFNLENLKDIPEIKIDNV